LWQTISDLWRIAKQLPDSRLARLVQLLSGLVIVAVAGWTVLSRCWRVVRGWWKPRRDDDDYETPEGA
jgi:hypothetical protein